MDVFIVDRRLYLFITCFFMVYVAANDRIKAPSEYYAIASSTAEIPCISGSHGKIRWKAENDGKSLRQRSRIYTDKSDPDMSVYTISNVQPSDAGTFVCSDESGTSSVELVVIQPTTIQDLVAEVTAPDEVKLTWKTPSKDIDVIRGYNVYTKEVAATGKEVIYPVDSVASDGEEEYPLTDISSGGTYDIQVAPLYHTGPYDADGRYEGPRSAKVRIKTPNFDASPGKVKAEPWTNSTVLVTWQPSKSKETSGVDGYIVYYQATGKKDKQPSGQIEVTKPEAGNRWSTVLVGLKTRTRYKIQVAAFTDGLQKTVGQKSPEIIFLHEGFVPELSIRAVPLSPDTVLVSLDTLGGDKVDKLRVLYSDDSAIKWNRINNFKVKENFGIVNGLQPRTRYFFMAKATVNKKARTVVTHLLTPPAGLASPTNVSVTAQTDSSVLVTWRYDGRLPATGFLVRVHQLQPGQQADHPDKTEVVFKANETLIKGLDSDQKYEVEVEAFDVESEGPSSEPIHFQLSVLGDTTTPAANQDQPPYFLDEQPEEQDMEYGDTIKLTCTANGRPHPSVQWFQDNAPVGKPANWVNEITLQGVKESTVLTCRATNSQGTTERNTKINVRRQPGVPRLTESLPETRVVRRGSELRQVCQATGSPDPRVLWYKDGTQVGSSDGVTGRSEFVEKRVDRDFQLKCVASNIYGYAESSIKVFVQEFLRAPSLKRPVHKRVEKIQGDELIIPCAFSGNPKPMVSWYDGATRLGEPQAEENTLQVSSVERATYYTCKGENLAGKSDTAVELIVRPREVSHAPPALQQVADASDYSIRLQHVPVSASDVKVKWIVDRGNLENIRYFDVTFSGDSYRYPHRERLHNDKRAIIFRQLKPQSRYTVNLQMVTYSGVVNSSLSFVHSATDSRQSDMAPVLYLDVVEIRNNAARLDFWTENIDRRQVYTYRLQVKDLDAGPIGNRIYNQEAFPSNTPGLVVESLKPNRHYEVILEAVAPYNITLLSTSARYFTPGAGQYGTPVSSSSATSPGQQPESVTAAAKPTTTTTTTTTVRPRTMNPRTQAPVRTTSRQYTTEAAAVTETTEDPVNHSYVMNIKIPNKTPYRVDIRWTVDQGPIENITGFLVTIKGDRGQILLQQNLPENQRYITIQSLSPDTTYFVDVKAKRQEDVLVESDVEVHTPPASTVLDTTNPVLELEANEVRSDSARIDWTVVRAEPELVASYRLKVLDGGPDGFNLLTQQLHASSQSLNLQQLEPNKRYHVILEALAPDNSVLLTSSLTFQTAKPSRYGVPVAASSSAMLENRPQERAVSRELLPAVLELEINPDEGGATLITWKVDNLSTEDMTTFQLVIRSEGPDGNILLERKLPVNSNAFRVSGLNTNRQYYIELQAVSPAGSTVVRAATVYSPGVSVTPLKIVSEGVQKSSKSSGQISTDDNVDDGAKPEIDMELVPYGHDQVKVNWSVIGENRRQPISSYSLKVSLDGPDGHVLHQTRLPTSTLYYIVSGLEKDVHYHIHLDALDAAGHLIEYVSAPYLVPPPGHGVEPYRTSSVFNKRSGTQQPEESHTARPPDAGAENSELTVTRTEAQSSDAMLLEWYDVTSANGNPTRDTLVRYAEFKDKERGDFQLEHVKAGQRRLLLRNLKPGTTYGIQVASVAPGGQYVRWSKLVLKSTYKQ